MDEKKSKGFGYLHKGRIFLWLCLCLCFATQIGFAAPSERAEYKVKSFTWQEIEETDEHPEGIRFEIGLDKPIQEIKDVIDAHDERKLNLFLHKTRLTKVKKNNDFDGKLVDAVEFLKIDRANSQVIITAARPFNNRNYKVYSLPADRKLRKPFRVVVEVFAKSEFKFTAGLADKRILIDAGHGGSDPGAIGPNGLREKDVALDVALKVEEILKKAGAKVIMTRKVDRDVYGRNASAGTELKARVNIGARQRADIFVSLHANSFTSPSAHGSATYYYKKNRYDELLAQSLQAGLVEYGGRYDRGIVEANFYVVKRTQLPAALVELAFISNPEEEALLGSSEYRQRLAEGICKGLSDFFVKAKN